MVIENGVSSFSRIQRSSINTQINSPKILTIFFFVEYSNNFLLKLNIPT